ncbi:MAG: hypothetical protein RL757_3381 [Bacteroidota bacterium]
MFLLMKKALLLFCCSTLTTGIFGQAAADTAVAPAKIHHGIAVGLASGALGYGGDVAYRLSKRFNVRLGYSTFSFNTTGYEPDFKALGFGNIPAGKLGVDVTGKIPTALLALEYMPFGSMFRLQGGISYALSGYGGSAKMRYLETLAFNDFVISPTDVGYMKISYTPKSSVAPYLAIGIGRAVPKKRLGLSLNLGAIYRDSPVLAVEATNFLAGNAANEPILNRNLAPYKWFPVADLRLAYRIR